ncbi:hypothetical protein HQN89_02155 [Paenibacillus frigoriresistens]|uniref:hypothetical protein n=1 Tax=Paenibacillus alginolyticus TaxID=59839 RepID=UPI001567035D|nr:hypothetical protein [Paenibacillus frigoriresistens]NRF89842.1 hypothetical protein [Paenibacillus frigoriresistens]
MSEVRGLFEKRSWSLVEDVSILDLGESDASIGEWREIKALHLKKAGTAILINNEFQMESFRIQASVAIPETVGFIGLVFGARDSTNYELIYLSPGDGTGNGEIQYDPVMNGSTTWQIYNGPSYLSCTSYNVGDWVRLTIDVNKHSAKVYIGDDFSTPQLIISKLQHWEVFGKIGVWGYLPVYIRDLSIEEIPSSYEPINKRCKDEFINEWLVSEPYHSNLQPEELKWAEVSTEENGTLNINRLYTSEKDKSVQIKSTFTLSEGALSSVSFGFSDEVRIWINEVEVYQDSCMWSPPEHDGRIRPDHVCIPIAWSSGVNTIRAEITSKETVFGWGFCLKTGIQSIN